jgi:hypothetical protein
MPVLEKEIETKVVKWAQNHGFLTPKVKFVEAGWPDRLFVSPYGATIFIEFKRPGERPDKLQEYRIQNLTDRGIPAFWTDSYDLAVTILRTALEAPPVSASRDEVAVEPDRSGAVSRSGLGEDEHCTGGPEGPVQQEFDFKDTDRGPVATNAEHVATGGKEVDRLSGDGTWDPTRWIEGSNACE